MTTPNTRTPGKPSRGMVAARIAAVTVVVVPLLTLASVGGYHLLNTNSTSGGTVTVEDDHAAFTLEVPAGTGIRYAGHVSADLDPDHTCEYAAYRLNAHNLVVEAVAADCDPDSQRVMNGHHGYYRTMDDVPEPKDIAEVDTELGPAEVFTQDYSESTNFTTEYVEPVAIVTLDHPVDPDYPTLVIRSEKGELDRDEFTALVEGLDEPH